jgi:Concanavalin A-like lectin/glucanases superfamily
MIDLGSPLNWQHPLNRGLRYHWLCLPGAMQGAIWRNTAHNPFTDANMSNGSTVIGKIYAQTVGMAAPGPTIGFNPTNRPGGWGEMRCASATTSYLTWGIGHEPNDAGTGNYTGPWTIAAWGYLNSTSGNGWMIAWGGGTTDKASFIGHIGTTLEGGGWGDDITSASFWGTYAWHHIVLTFDGSDATSQKHANMYADGRLVAGPTTKSWGTLNNTLGTIGAQLNLGEQWNGGLDDLRLYDRVLSADEVVWLYHDSQNQSTPLYSYLGDLALLTASQVSIVERRTLSPFGTRVGSRQEQR